MQRRRDLGCHDDPSVDRLTKEGARWQARISAQRHGGTSRTRRPARRKKTITKLSKKRRGALGREGAKAAARKRGCHEGHRKRRRRETMPELRREAARLGIGGRSKMGKAQLIRAVGPKRRAR